MNSERVKKNIIINYRPAHPNSNCRSPGPSVFIPTALASPGCQRSASHPLAFRETVAPEKLKSAADNISPSHSRIHVVF